MKEEYKKLIDEKFVKEIAGGLHCPKDFKCTSFEFENLCKAVDIGKENCLECLEKKLVTVLL
jgi:hypothetical protein